jgi:hypothetical protein
MARVVVRECQPSSLRARIELWLGYRQTSGVASPAAINLAQNEKTSCTTATSGRLSPRCPPPVACNVVTPSGCCSSVVSTSLLMYHRIVCLVQKSQTKMDFHAECKAVKIITEQAKEKAEQKSHRVSGSSKDQQEPLLWWGAGVLLVVPRWRISWR